MLALRRAAGQNVTIVDNCASDAVDSEEGLDGPSQGGSSPTHLVAIGASAGGLDALERFFDGVPADTGAAYVVIQHLSPDHKSMMSTLLARHTTMPVLTVTDGQVLQANVVHLIPPNAILRVEGDTVHFRGQILRPCLSTSRAQTRTATAGPA